MQAADGPENQALEGNPDHENRAKEARENSPVWSSMQTEYCRGQVPETEYHQQKNSRKQKIVEGAGFKGFSCDTYWGNRIYHRSSTAGDGTETNKEMQADHPSG